MLQTPKPPAKNRSLLTKSMASDLFGNRVRHSAPYPYIPDIPAKFSGMPLSIPYRHAINELAELRIESSVLAERVDNALKLIGDLYLARVYSAASEQFHMPTWDASISRKLDIIGNLYQLLTDRVNSSQAQMLELIIIILIVIEIFLSLSHGS